MLFGIFQLRVGNVLLVYLLFSFSTNVYIFWNLSYRILQIFYTSLLRYAWNHGSTQVYIQIPICLCVECLCYLFKNIFLEKQIVCGHSFHVYVKISIVYLDCLFDVGILCLWRIRDCNDSFLRYVTTISIIWLIKHWWKLQSIPNMK